MKRDSQVPSHHIRMSVAGAEISIRSELDVIPCDERPYVPFQDTGPADRCGADIDVEVLATPCPVSDAPVVFDSEFAWYMQREPSGYRVSYRRLDNESVHTVLCADQGTTRVRFFVHQDEPPEISIEEGVMNPVHYPLDQVLMMNHLAERGGLIAHAAGAVVEGRAFVMAGVSGAGKSTISYRFIDAGLRDSLLSDDRVIIRKALGATGESMVAWGTPWPGDAGVARNESAPLAAVLFLIKADTERVEPLPANMAMRRLMPVVSCPWYDPERLAAVLETCARIVETVPCYDLHFRRDIDVMAMLAGRSW